MPRVLHAAAAATLLVALGAAPATAGLVTIEASRDNTLYEDADGALSNALGNRMFAGLTAQGARRRALVYFDVAGALPADAVVTGASVQLSAVMSIAAPQEYGLHRVLADWGEGTSQALGGQGGGADATTGDATWLHGFYDDVLWSAPGGDFDPVASAVQTADSGASTWTGAGLVDDVQAWLDAPSENYGWMLRGPEDLLEPSARAFATHEWATASMRPQLVVEFETVPAPGALALLGGAAMAGRRRRR